MLVEKQPESTVVCFRIKSGDEIMGVLVPYFGDQDGYKISNPAIITLTPTGNGQVNVNLGPYLTGAVPNGTVHFTKDAVMNLPVPVRPEAEKQYRKVMMKVTD